ncbi:cystatin-B-like [Tachyglossus aculeatus]|uniref:cystatin-B-like n=1 Tax=Tachyglossus aculeatus TaxID=9261 RepID=UPI0018F52486|nr:cystatin-B-like [Tachyglossus aculeatus]
MLCGGTSKAQPATAQTQRIADQVKAQIEAKENKTYPVFQAVEFKSQVVAGTNYFIKVHVGDEAFVHLRVFESLPHENKPPSLTSYQVDKAKGDQLTYF